MKKKIIYASIGIIVILLLILFYLRSCSNPDPPQVPQKPEVSRLPEETIIQSKQKEEVVISSPKKSVIIDSSKTEEDHVESIKSKVVIEGPVHVEEGGSIVIDFEGETRTKGREVIYKEEIQEENPTIKAQLSSEQLILIPDTKPTPKTKVRLERLISLGVGPDYDFSNIGVHIDIGIRIWKFYPVIGINSNLDPHAGIQYKIGELLRNPLTLGCAYSLDQAVLVTLSWRF